MAGINPNRTVLAHWTYETEEWRCFTNWKVKKRGRIPYLYHVICHSRRRLPPEVTITTGSVWTNEAGQFFNLGNHRLHSVSIRDAGHMNVMAIRYRSSANADGEICLLIPKGRLREAIEIQELLAESIPG